MPWVVEEVKLETAKRRIDFEKAMDTVRRTEMSEDAQAVGSAIGGNDRKAAKQLMWGMRRNPSSWSAQQAGTDLRAWLSWARRCRLEPFKKLAATLKDRFDAVVRGMPDRRSNAFVEAKNGLSAPAPTSSPSPACVCPSSSTCRLTPSPRCLPNESVSFHTKRNEGPLEQTIASFFQPGDAYAPG